MLERDVAFEKEPSFAQGKNAQDYDLKKEAHSDPANIGELERNLSVVGGAGLILGGLARRGIGGLILAGLGALFLERGVSGRCRVYQRLGVSSAKSDRPGVPDNLGIKVEKEITINRPVSDVFEFWKDLRNLSQHLEFIERVDLLEGKKSHWVARGFAGSKFEWDAEVINEHPNALLAWESVPGAQVQNAGSVRFEPVQDGHATHVRVSLAYNPPGGVFGAIGARIFSQSVEDQIERDLRKLKMILETPVVSQ